MDLQEAFNSPRGPSVPVVPDRNGTSEDRLLELLEISDIDEIGLHPAGSNYVFILRLAAEVEGEVPLLAVYKPQAGERPLRDFPSGLHRRERAAYLLSRALGWPAIPPTVIRDGPHGEGSVQLFIHADLDETYFTMRDAHRKLFEPIAAFDILVNNADRKGGACLKDADGRMWAIDHGLTFNPDARVRTVMFEFCGDPFRPSMVRDMEALRPRLSADGDVAASLAELIADYEIEALRQRLDRLIARPEFPLLDEYYNVPWPLV